MSEWTDAKIRWAATKIQASIRGLLQRWRDLNLICKGSWILTEEAPDHLCSKRQRGNMQLHLHATPIKIKATQSKTDRFQRRIRRAYTEPVALGMLRLFYTRRMTTLDKKTIWINHRKRLGVKLLDFGS